MTGTNNSVIYIKHEKFPWMVGSNGEIFSLRTGKFLTFQINRRYFKVGIKNPSPTTMFVHRVIAEAFFGKSKLEVNHKDKNSFNNDISNLEYVTREENQSHRHMGRKRFVCLQKGKWTVQITKNKKLIYRSYGLKFNTKEDAYSHAKEVYYKQFGVYPWE